MNAPKQVSSYITKMAVTTPQGNAYRATWNGKHLLIERTLVDTKTNRVRWHAMSSEGEGFTQDVNSALASAPSVLVGLLRHACRQKTQIASCTALKSAEDLERMVERTVDALIYLQLAVAVLPSTLVDQVKALLPRKDPTRKELKAARNSAVVRNSYDSLWAGREVEDQHPRQWEMEIPNLG